jgi:hypothetical protein
MSRVGQQGLGLAAATPLKRQLLSQSNEAGSQRLGVMGMPADMCLGQSGSSASLTDVAFAVGDTGSENRGEGTDH